MQVSRNLFRWTREMAYADYYERALTNGVLSIQRGRQPGVMIYMLPQGPGQSKARSYHGWGTQFNAFWCCYGTGSVMLLVNLLFIISLEKAINLLCCYKWIFLGDPFCLRFKWMPWFIIAIHLLPLNCLGI